MMSKRPPFIVAMRAVGAVLLVWLSLALALSDAPLWAIPLFGLPGMSLLAETSWDIGTTWSQHRARKGGPAS